MFSAVLCLLCLVFMSLVCRQELRKYDLAAVIMKGLASLCFVLLGVLGCRLSGGGQMAKLVVLGLVLGCVADVLLDLRFVSEKLDQPIFLLGILVFLAGHVVYLAAILPSSRQLLLCILASVVMTALLMRWLFSKVSANMTFKVFGVFYIGAIVLLSCVSVGILLVSPSAFAGVFTAGVLLFLVSDVVLILNNFGPEYKFSLRIVSLSLYYIGQLLIALSLQVL